MYNIDSEIGTLNILLNNPDLAESTPNLKPFMYSASTNSAIYDCIYTIQSQGHIPDYTLVYNKLVAEGNLDKAGGKEYLEYIKSSTEFTKENLSEFTKQIINGYKARSLVSITSNINKKVETEDIDTVISNLETQLGNLQENSASDKVVDFYSATKTTWDELEFRMNNPGITGITTGLKSLDLHTGGFNKGKLWIIAARPSMGKGLTLDSGVLTPTGWVKMGKLQVGDLVCGKDGKGYSVTGVYPQGIKPVYRVHFDDGSSVDCDDSHLWYTTTRKDRKAGRTYAVRSTLDVIKEGIITKDGRNNHAVPINDPIEFVGKEELPLHPYLVGYLLGNGCMVENGCPQICMPDEYTVKFISSILPEGYSLGASDKISYNLRSKGKGIDVLTKLGMYSKHSYEKSIPESYKFLPLEERLWLLRGLMDSDGCAVTSIDKPDTNCFIEYSTTSEQLAKDVMDLCRSFGAKVSCKSRMGKYKNKEGEVIETRINYRIQGSFTQVNPFYLPRKACKFSPVKSYHNKYIVKVERLEDQQTQCIRVDSPDHLFIAEGYNVTHNSMLLANMLLRGAESMRDTGEYQLVFSLEMQNSELISRMLALHTGVPLEDILFGTLTQRQLEQIQEGMKYFKTLPILLDDTPGTNAMRFNSIVRRYNRTKKIRVVHFDYLQLGVERDEGHMNELVRFTKTAKNLAKELDATCVFYSQLNRGVESRDDKRPLLSDLRQSGNIEEDADIVDMLFREEYYLQEKSKHKGVLEHLLRKNRNGKVGMFTSKFEGALMRITDD
jgi:replicative DNA helicase